MGKDLKYCCFKLLNMAIKLWGKKKEVGGASKMA